MLSSDAEFMDPRTRVMDPCRARVVFSSWSQDMH